MEDENFFFYLPPGSFTSFELLSIRYKSSNDNQIKLQIQYNDSTITLPNPKKEGDILYWSSDLAPDFSCSRVSKFNLIANNVSIPVDFNDLTLIASPKYFTQSEIKNIFVFCFLSGYFARKSDYEMLSLRATPNLKCINQNRLDAYQSICKEYKEKLHKFEDIQNNRLKPILTNRQIYQEKASQSRIQKFEEYNEATKDTPILNLKYPLEPSDNHLQSSAFSTVFQTSINFSTESTSLSFRMPTSRSNPDLKELNKFSDIQDTEKATQNDSENHQISNIPSTIQPLHPMPHLSQRRSSCTPKTFNDSLSNIDPMAISGQIMDTHQLQTQQNSQENMKNQTQQNLEEQQVKQQTPKNKPIPQQQQNSNIQSSNEKKGQVSTISKNHIFPEARQGPRSPSQDEIRMFLSELPIIFPIDVEKRTFCNISADDPDIQSNKMLLFNTIHFLALFAEFTGIIYQYRIGMADGGWYKLEDRITGVEVKREITSKNVMLSPLKTAVINCLKKIVYEFNLKVKDTDDMISLLDAVLNFYQQLN